MEETFDWINESIDSIKEAITDILDLDFLDLIEDIDSDGQDRNSLREILYRQAKHIKLEIHGFDLNLMYRLLNQVPFYREGVIKEPISKEMREFIYNRDDYTCQLCYRSWRDVYCHHIDPQGSANDDNLITLCNACHEIIHRLLKNKGYPYHIPGRRW